MDMEDTLVSIIMIMKFELVEFMMVLKNQQLELIEMLIIIVLLLMEIMILHSGEVYLEVHPIRILEHHQILGIRYMLVSL